MPPEVWKKSGNRKPVKLRPKFEKAVFRKIFHDFALKTENIHILSITTDIVCIITHKLVYKEVIYGQNRQKKYTKIALNRLKFGQNLYYGIL